MKKRILLCDDHHLFGQGIISLLEEEKDIEVLGIALNVKECITKCLGLKPDILLLDYFLPDGTGLDVYSQIKNFLPHLKVILLTMERDPSVMKACDNAGIDGYLLKNISRDELLDAIARVERNERYFMWEMADTNHEVGSASKIHKLSHREREIAQLVAEGLTTLEISERLNLSAFTVSTHRRNMLQKLGIHNSAQLINLVRSTG